MTPAYQFFLKLGLTRMNKWDSDAQNAQNVKGRPFLITLMLLSFIF